MELTIYQIDAFANKIFEGNPAAVCPLKEWLPKDTMQSIAAENNLSETAFYIPTDAGFHIRWFTPTMEVDLCGHATLAAAYVLYELEKYQQSRIPFDSRSGFLNVSRQGDLIKMDFPSQPPTACDLPETLKEIFPNEPQDCLCAEDYLLVFEHESIIKEIQPELEAMKKIDRRGVIVSAPSDKYDFVSRFFAPKYGINEDSVTGSAHTQLAPYWSSRLNKQSLKAKQVSPRGGELLCEVLGNRIQISGTAVKYLEGKINIST